MRCRQGQNCLPSAHGMQPHLHIEFLCCNCICAVQGIASYCQRPGARAPLAAQLYWESTACSFASCALTSCSCSTVCLKNSLVLMPKLQVPLTLYMQVGRVPDSIQQWQMHTPRTAASVTGTHTIYCNPDSYSLSQGLTQHTVIPIRTLERRVSILLPNLHV